jgi:hypothetical protein
MVGVLVRRIAVAVLLCLASAGCGGEPHQPNSPNTPPPTSGSRRLVWSQLAPGSTLTNYSFSLFVDDAREGTLAASCTLSSASSGLFECSAPLPALPSGRHVLQVSTIDPRGVESERSPGVTANIGELADEAPSLSALPEEGAVTCIDRAPRTCFTIQQIGTIDEPVRRISALPDGRTIMLLESGDVAILSERRSRIDRTRLAFDRGEVVDIAVSARFSETHEIYVMVLSDTKGQRSADLVRTRELEGQLGEPSRIVTGLPITALGTPAFDVDPAGRLDVALPLARSTADVNSPYDGHVLRFDASGLGAGHPTNRSPVFAYGVSRPSMLSSLGANGVAIAAESGAPGLFLIRENATTWPAQMERVAGAPVGEVRALVRGATSTRAGLPVFMLVGSERLSLVAGLLQSGSPPSLRETAEVPLGGIVPAAIGLVQGSGVVMAARPTAGATRIVRVEFSSRLH